MAEFCRRCRETWPLDEPAPADGYPDAVCIPWGRYFPDEARMPLCEECAHQTLGRTWDDLHTRRQSAVYVLPTPRANDDRETT